LPFFPRTVALRRGQSYSVRMGELGTRLRQQREARGLTIEDAERDTRISRRYLVALESEQFEVIPAPAYARGFLRSYSQYLGLDPQETLRLFPRDDEGGSGGAVGTMRPSREHPVPSTSASRPSWKRPTAGQPPGRDRPSRAPVTQPTSGAFPGTRGSPASGPAEIPLEPTIGIDIGVALPARRLERDANASTRATLLVLGAAVTIAVVIGIAWLISRAGDDSTPVLDGTTPTGPAGAAAASPTSNLPAVPRGVVPDITGLPAAAAKQLVAAAGYQVVESLQKSPNVARGMVIDQSPARGTQLAEGQVVRIQVSDGP